MVSECEVQVFMSKLDEMQQVFHVRILEIVIKWGEWWYLVLMVWLTP